MRMMGANIWLRKLAIVYLLLITYLSCITTDFLWLLVCYKAPTAAMVKPLARLAPHLERTVALTKNAPANPA
jgi:hypothetical protein